MWIDVPGAQERNAGGGVPYDVAQGVWNIRGIQYYGAVFV